MKYILLYCLAALGVVAQESGIHFTRGQYTGGEVIRYGVTSYLTGGTTFVYLTPEQPSFFYGMSVDQTVEIRSRRMSDGMTVGPVVVNYVDGEWYYASVDSGYTAVDIRGGGSVRASRTQMLETFLYGFFTVCGWEGFMLLLRIITKTVNQTTSI